MSDTSPFQQALRDELIRLPLKAPRRRWLMVVTAVGSAVAALVGLLAFANVSPAAADVHVQLKGGRVEVLLTDLDSTPGDVVRAFHAAGLRVRVESQPAGPSNVGRFVQALVDGPDPEPIQRVEEGVNSFMGFSLPVGWKGTLVIALGREAHRGETYAIPSDAFAPREPLHCTAVLGAPLSAHTKQLRNLSIRVQPIDDGLLAPPQQLTAAVLAQYGQWYVIRGLAASPRAVLLEVARSPDPKVDLGC
jgi:hypothetical protein